MKIVMRFWSQLVEDKVKIKIRAEHGDKTTEDFGDLSCKRNSFWNSNRYSAFDCLRFGLDKNTQMGWSTYLLGEREV